ncbi:MAG: fatty acid desaturase [Ilumatobacteraceae bacterium]
MTGMAIAAMPECRETTLIRADGRPTAEFREQLRCIPSCRNAWSVLFLYVQTGAVLWATVALTPWIWPVTFVLMGRTFAQFLSLMHDAAHRLLFSDKRVNDFVGRWLLGYPSLTNIDGYRRVHAAHHREEFGPDEPDLALYAGYPISPASFRRKLVRDATGRTGMKLMAQFLAAARSTDPRARRTFWKIMLVQAVLLAAAIVAGSWWLYPVFWLGPYLTVWRVINRLRSIAEHGGMHASKDRRQTTHAVAQHPLARFMLVPYRIGLHLPHHVDSGVPFRNLPKLDAALREAGYIDGSFEHRSYPAIWKALRTPSASTR